MDTAERRGTTRDRRRVPRGGRRPYDEPGKHPPVLVADTDESVRRAFVRYLDLYGFRVAHAARLDDGLAASEGASKPDLIVAELTSAAAARLARSAPAPTIVTATDDILAQPRYASAILVKPFPLPALLDEVRRVIRQHVTPAPTAD